MSIQYKTSRPCLPVPAMPAMLPCTAKCLEFSCAGRKVVHMFCHGSHIMQMLRWSRHREWMEDDWKACLWQTTPACFIQPAQPSAPFECTMGNTHNTTQMSCCTHAHAFFSMPVASLLLFFCLFVPAFPKMSVSPLSPCHAMPKMPSSAHPFLSHVTTTQN